MSKRKTKTAILNDPREESSFKAEWRKRSRVVSVHVVLRVSGEHGLIFCAARHGTADSAETEQLPPTATLSVFAQNKQQKDAVKMAAAATATAHY